MSIDQPHPVSLSPAAFDQMLAMVAENITAQVLGTINVEDLQMIDLSTCAAFLGIPLGRAAKVLPYAEFGPRTRRVRISDFKAYQEANMRRPKK